MSKTKKDYQVNLFHGCMDWGDDELINCYMLADPSVHEDLKEVEGKLVDLVRSPDDAEGFDMDDFHYYQRPLSLPDSLVERIKADAIEEYKATQARA